MNPFHPELRWISRLIPRFSFAPWIVFVARLVRRWRGVRRPPAVEGLRIEDVYLPTKDGVAIRLRIYRPLTPRGKVPAMLWVHGGGFIVGCLEQDEPRNISLACELGMVIVALDYRLAPEHPFPAALVDCYVALLWLHSRALNLGIDNDRIAVGGGSAGGGLAAGLVLMAHDRAEVPVTLQLLIYPMLDDRSTLKSDLESPHHRLWNANSNAFGWSAFLGQAPGGDGISEYAAPARRGDLSGLPPAWIGVGTLDLFHDEDVDFARRLSEAGTSCELQVIKGAFHGFDYLRPKTQVVRLFQRSYTDFLKRGLQP